VFVAFEHSSKGVVAKTYFVPPTDGTGSGAPPNWATFVEAVRSIVPHSKAMHEMIRFTESAPGLNPDMLATDCVDPQKSRIKLYVGASSGTSIKDMLFIMSLGGKVQVADQTAASLARLVQQVLGPEHEPGLEEKISVQTPFDTELAHPFDSYAKVVYYFDIAPKSDLPDVKLYIPVNRYGRSDSDVAAGLASWLHSEGRGQYVDGLLRALKDVSQKNSQGQGHGVQNFIAIAIRKDGTLDLTSYLNPGVYYTELKAKSARPW
jgi:DMATS type aromatic prenyltransferase